MESRLASLNDLYDHQGTPRRFSECMHGGHDYFHRTGHVTHARIRAIAFMHRFGSALNTRLHLPCVVIDGVLAPTPTEGAIVHPAIALDPLATATVQANVRRRLLQSFVRHRLLAHGDAQAMAQ